MTVRHAEDADVADHAYATFHHLLNSENCRFESGVIYIYVNAIRAGQGNKPHAHSDVEQMYYVLSGEGLVRCGDEESSIRSGDAVHLPVGVEHSVSNTGEEALRVIVVGARTSVSE